MKKGPTEYIQHTLLDLLPVKFKLCCINDQKKVLRYFFNDEDGSSKLENLEAMVTAQLVVNEKKIQPAQQTLFIDKMLFEQNIIFNYKYKDLSYNSIIAITLWCSQKNKDEKKPLGCTTISLFDDQFRLRQGKYHLYIWPDTLPDTSYTSITPGLVTDDNIKQINFSHQKTEQAFTNVYKSSQKTGSSVHRNQLKEQLDLQKIYAFQKIPSAFLEIDFPNFENLVLYQEPGYIIDNDLSSKEINNSQSNSSTNATQQSLTGGKSSKFFVQEVDFSECVVTSDFDYENRKDDLFQEQTALIIREDENPQQLKPSKNELQIIENSIKKPILGELKQDEKLLFYRFRYSLIQNSEALVKFLHSINWDNQKELNEAKKLLKNWAKCSYGDALHLLSSSFCANEFYNKKYKKPQDTAIFIRKYACEQLEKEQTSTICSILLQLTQALRYEPFDYQKSHLAQFLVKKACENTEIATLFYWYLLVECDKEMDQKEKLKLSSTNLKVQEWFNQVFEKMNEELEEKCEENHQILSLQSEFRQKLRQIVASMAKKDRTQKIEIIKKKLASEEFKRPNFKEHPFCLNPNLMIVESIHQQSTVFKSAMAPIKMTFTSYPIGQKEKEGKVEMIYKNGDDLRQDQLVMQIFNLMDGLLKGVGQDFRLMPYKVLACSKNDGFMEFVPNSTTIQDLLKGGKQFSQYLQNLAANPENPIYEEYKRLRMQNDESGKLSNIEYVSQKIMENYMLSCAGYSVMTYFLGVGDRHLENLMVDITGKFFHIDFGFILGQDPKPYPPPLKLCRQMIEGMGGKDSKVYAEFRKKCVHAYIYLRKYAKLIVNLFHLMIDSGIKDMSIEALEKLAEKFYLDLNDTQAELHFLNILDESETALFARVTDIIHKWATYWRA
ncbi:hypothetical protein ABPG72_019023 [Tetrahymena utriculariae]